MDQVHYKQVASCGELDFYSDAHARTVYALAFCPVNVARRFQSPACGLLELPVNELSYGGSAIGVLLFLNKKREAGDRLANFF